MTFLPFGVHEVWKLLEVQRPDRDSDARPNQLFNALEPAVRERINRHLRPVTPKLGAVVCEAGGLLEHAYFPEGSVLSLLTVFGERLSNRNREHRAGRGFWSLRGDV
jgi:hypothetical protein